VTVEVPTTAEDARRLTDEIKADLADWQWRGEAIGRKLASMQASGTWRLIGYETWNAYVDGEFAMTRQRANQLIQHEQFVNALESGADMRASA